MSEANEKQQWGSAFGFIVSSIGYAVGVGAIWKFPYMMGMNGGGIFLLLCIIFAIIIAIPLCWAELTLGRYTQKSVIACYKDLNAGGIWSLISWMGLATVIILISYYITIVSDVMFYIFKYLSGGLSKMGIDELGDYYWNLQLNMPYKWVTVLILYAATIVVILGGVQKGLERANKILIPGLFIFLCILAIRGLMLPGAGEGLKFVFAPDTASMAAAGGFFKVAMGALNQCFFLAGVGMATLYSFGSYLDRENSDIPFSGSVIILSNIVVAILAGVAIFPALFTYNMDVAGGSGLVFKTLPYVFTEMAGGRLWGTLFFLLLFAAGWSSVLGLFEGAASTMADGFGWTRTKAVAVVTVICIILGAFTIHAFTQLENVTPLGMDFFTFMDFVAMLITLPIGVIIMSIFLATKFWDKFLEHSAVGAKYFKIPHVLKGWYLVVLPVITAVVVIMGIRSYF